MARKDWINVGISSLLIEGIDNFLKSEGGEMTKTGSRQAFVNRLIIGYFASYRQKTGINYLPVPKEEEKIPTLFDLLAKKTKK